MPRRVPGERVTVKRDDVELAVTIRDLDGRQRRAERHHARLETRRVAKREEIDDRVVRHLAVASLDDASRLQRLLRGRETGHGEQNQESGKSRSKRHGSSSA